MSIPKADNDRLIHINFTMNEIHDSADAIYEHLIDREYAQVLYYIDNLQLVLKTLEETIRDGEEGM
jgi:hypothetical protein